MGRKIRRRKRSYRQFIEGKITVAERVGFEVDPAELHPSTMPHQALGGLDEGTALVVRAAARVSRGC